MHWSVKHPLFSMEISHVMRGSGTSRTVKVILHVMTGSTAISVICVEEVLLPRSCWSVTWLHTMMIGLTYAMCVGRSLRDYMKWHCTKKSTLRLEITFVIFAVMQLLRKRTSLYTVRGTSKSSRSSVCCVERDFIQISSWRNTSTFTQVKNRLSVIFVGKHIHTRTICWPTKRQTIQTRSRTWNVIGVTRAAKHLRIRSHSFCT
jgi:hypothetical protein